MAQVGANPTKFFFTVARSWPRGLFLLALMCAISGGVPAQGEDWPRWRGPRGDGSWNAPPLAQDWRERGPEIRWRTPLGAGYSGVAVSAGKVYTMDRPKPTNRMETPDGQERVLCLDAITGQISWQCQYPAHYGKLDYGNGPRSMPTIHEGKVFTLGAVGQVCCLDAQTGKLLWSKRMVEDYQARIPEWGFAAAPLVVGETVIIHAGATPNGSLMAFALADGREVWRSLPDPAGYGTPILVEPTHGTPNQRQLVIWTPENVRAVDANSGKLLWTIPYKVTYGVSIATPIYHQGIVIVAGYWEGSKAILLQESGVRLLWEENRFLRGIMAPPLYRDGFVYLLDKSHGVVCFDLRTGEKRWNDNHRFTPRDRNPQLTMVWTGAPEEVLVFNAEGELILARISPQGFKEITRAKLMGRTWANPAFAGSSVFARDDKEIVRADLPLATP